MKSNELFTELIHTIRDSLLSDDFLDEFRVPGHYVRKGKISFRQMAMFLFFHCKTNLDIKLAKFTEDLVPDFEMPKVSRQALSKARYGIQFELFREIFNLSVSFYYENVPFESRKKWLDRYFLFAIDGSDMEVPSSPGCYEEFGKQHDEKNPDLFWAMAQASTLYDVLEDKVVDAGIEHLYESEREFALKHLSRMASLNLQKNAVVIYDRGYYSAELFHECNVTGCKALMRLSKKSNLCKLKGNDVITMVKAPDDTMMECRVLKVTLSTGETEYLITSIMDKDITPEMFCELYFERWKIETKYLEMKDRWNIEEFTGKNPLAVRQDFFITMLHINLASIIKEEADKEIEKTANLTNQYQYQARRTFIISRVQVLFIKWVLTSFDQKNVDKLILDASKKRSQIKQGRNRKRKRPTRARKHYNNQKATC